MAISFLNGKYTFHQILKIRNIALWDTIKILQEKCKVNFNPDLHLAVSMRSYMVENVSHFVKCLLDLDMKAAKETLSEINAHYPIVLTRDVVKAKTWLREKAGEVRGMD